MALSSDQKVASALSIPENTSAKVCRVSGSGAAGIESWWSIPAASVWNEVITDRIGWSFWIAWTPRAENECLSRSLSTTKRIGALESPARKK